MREGPPQPLPPRERLVFLELTFSTRSRTAPRSVTIAVTRSLQQAYILNILLVSLRFTTSSRLIDSGPTDLNPVRYAPALGVRCPPVGGVITGNSPPLGGGGR